MKGIQTQLATKIEFDFGHSYRNLGGSGGGVAGSRESLDSLFIQNHIY